MAEKVVALFFRPRRPCRASWLPLLFYYRNRAGQIVCGKRGKVAHRYSKLYQQARDGHLVLLVPPRTVCGLCSLWLTPKGEVVIAHSDNPVMDSCARTIGKLPPIKRRRRG